MGLEDSLYYRVIISQTFMSRKRKALKSSNAKVVSLTEFRILPIVESQNK